MSLAKTFALKTKYLLKLCLKCCLPLLQLLSHDGAHKLVGACVEAARLKQNFNLEWGLDGHLVDHKGARLPRVSGLLLVVGRPVGVYSNVMPLFTRGGAVDEPAIQALLYDFSQCFQSRRDSLKVVVTEKIKKINVFLAVSVCTN